MPSTSQKRLSEPSRNVILSFQLSFSLSLWPSVCSPCCIFLSLFSSTYSKLDCSSLSLSVFLLLIFVCLHTCQHPSLAACRHRLMTSKSTYSAWNSLLSSRHGHTSLLSVLVRYETGFSNLLCQNTTLDLFLCPSLHQQLDPPTQPAPVTQLLSYKHQASFSFPHTPLSSPVRISPWSSTSKIYSSWDMGKEEDGLITEGFQVTS